MASTAPKIVRCIDVKGDLSFTGLQVVTAGGTAYPLSCPPIGTTEVKCDLSQIPGFLSGTEFQVRLGNATYPVNLTYISASEKTAFFTAMETPEGPVFDFYRIG